MNFRRIVALLGYNFFMLSALFPSVAVMPLFLTLVRMDPLAFSEIVKVHLLSLYAAMFLPINTAFYIYLAKICWDYQKSLKTRKRKVYYRRQKVDLT